MFFFLIKIAIGCLGLGNRWISKRVSYRTKFFELKITYGRVINDDNRTYVSLSPNF